MLRLISSEEILANIYVFRQLTIDPASDMNIMLNELMVGKVDDVIAAVFEQPELPSRSGGSKTILGWSAIYTTHHKNRLMDVFVTFRSQRRGIGSSLVRHVLNENEKAGYVKPIISDEPAPFWKAFADRVVHLSQTFPKAQPKAVQSSSPVGASSSNTGNGGLGSDSRGLEKS